MSTIILQGLDVTDLRNIISDVLKEHALLAPVLTTTTKTEFLTRQEVSKLLQISLPTLHDYTKKGIVLGYRIGNKVRYKRTEIENSLTIIKSLKHKHYGTQK
jgi:excisionase family DNA binding protein